MSFSFEFNAASKEDAMSLVNQQYCPETIKMFLIASIEGCGDNAVHVKAIGHLQSNGQATGGSNADIRVEPIRMTLPKPSS